MQESREAAKTLSLSLLVPTLRVTAIKLSLGVAKLQLSTAAAGGVSADLEVSTPRVCATNLIAVTLRVGMLVVTAPCSHAAQAASGDGTRFEYCAAT